MDDLFVIEFNARFVKSYKQRLRAEHAFQRATYRISDGDVMRMIGLPSGHCYCSTK